MFDDDTMVQDPTDDKEDGDKDEEEEKTDGDDENKAE